MLNKLLEKTEEHLVRVRDYILLIHLFRCLSSLAGSLEDCETIDEDDSWIVNGVPPIDIERTPDIAIQQIRSFQNEIWRCELLAATLTLSDLKLKILTALVECREAICQADVPAEMEFLNGNAQEAIRICQDAMRLAQYRTLTEHRRRLYPFLSRQKLDDQVWCGDAPRGAAVVLLESRSRTERGPRTPADLQVVTPCCDPV